MVEGAPDSTLRFRRKSFAESCAPSTALLRSAVPLPRFAGEDEEKDEE